MSAGAEKLSLEHPSTLFTHVRSWIRQGFESEYSDDSAGSDGGGTESRDGRGDEEYLLEVAGGSSRKDRSKKPSKPRVRVEMVSSSCMGFWRRCAFFAGLVSFSMTATGLLVMLAVGHSASVCVGSKYLRRFTYRYSCRRLYQGDDDAS